MAGVGPRDIDYLGLYDPFTITVLEQREGLGFCEKWRRAALVAMPSLRRQF